MGLVQGFSGLVAARWFLGITESGMYDCCGNLDLANREKASFRQHPSS